MMASSIELNNVFAFARHAPTPEQCGWNLRAKWAGMYLKMMRTRGYSGGRRAATLAQFDLTAYTYSSYVVCTVSSDVTRGISCGGATIGKGTHVILILKETF
jgi:hypothetical protein